MLANNTGVPVTAGGYMNLAWCVERSRFRIRIQRRTTGLYHPNSFTTLLEKYIRLFTFRERSIDLPCVFPAQPRNLRFGWVVESRHGVK